MKKRISALVGLSAAVAAFGAVGVIDAGADHNSVDGSVSSGTYTCSWTNGSTDANPPSALAIENSSVNSPGGNLSCNQGSATLDNDPDVTFNDANGTATVGTASVTVTDSGITCKYKATNVAMTGDTSTREYSGSGTATRQSGSSFLCSSSPTFTFTLDFN